MRLAAFGATGGSETGIGVALAVVVVDVAHEGAGVPRQERGDDEQQIQ
jgi:hypothetical protein